MRNAKRRKQEFQGDPQPRAGAGLRYMARGLHGRRRAKMEERGQGLSRCDKWRRLSADNPMRRGNGAQRGAESEQPLAGGAD